MKIKNFTIYFFAIIGFVVIACSAAATADDNPPTVFSNIGKYQISLGVDSDKSNAGVRDNERLLALNTETGVCKTYHYNSTLEKWIETAPATITFTH